MKKLFKNNIKSIFTGVLAIVTLFFMAYQVNAGWSYSNHSIPYSVVKPPKSLGVTLVANPNSITQPDSATHLTWVTYGAPDSCKAITNLSWSGDKSASGGGEDVGGLTNVGTYTFKISCYKDAFEVSSQATVTVLPKVDPKVVTAKLIADPALLPVSGDYHTALKWTSANATSCTGVNFDTGSATSGYKPGVLVMNTKTFTINCTDGGVGPDHNASSSATVTVITSDPGSILVTLTADQAYLPFGGGSDGLTLTSVNATSCASPDFDTYNLANGHFGVTLTNTTTYTVNCDGPYGSGTATATITVLPKGVDPVTAKLIATPDVLPSNGDYHTSLKWGSTNAVSCTSNDFSTNGNTEGTIDGVLVNATKTFTVICTGAGGDTAQADATVVVKTKGGGDTQCSDGKDNDGDGLIDADDPSCHTDCKATSGKTINPKDTGGLGEIDGVKMKTVEEERTKAGDGTVKGDGTVGIEFSTYDPTLNNEARSCTRSIHEIEI